MAVSSEYLKYWVMGEGLVQLLVKSVKMNGDSTQPCGAPVLVMMVDDVVEPTRTDCGRSHRKLSTQWMSRAGTLSCCRLRIILGR